MQAIEISTKVDSKGNLNISLPVSFKKQKVKVIIMYNDNEHEDEKIWLSDLKKNASFDFLNNVEEDIYNLNDGKPYHAK